MNFQTETGATTGVFVAHRHEAILPTAWQNCRFHAHPVRVIAKRLVERRAFTNRTVNQVTIGRIAQGENIRLNGDEQFIGSLGKLAEHRLTANDDEFRRTGDAGGSPDDMFKLLPAHDGSGI